MHPNPRLNAIAAPSAITALVAIVLTAAGCQKAAETPSAPPAPAAPASTAPAATPALPVVADAEIQRIAPMVAPEYFETLTEAAFTDTPAQLDAAIASARAASSRDGKRLPAPAQAELVHRLEQIRQARAADNRADLAIASIEGYRLFVSAGINVGSAPVEVALLDYSGFRYGADLAATPTRWDDARAASAFAETRWAAIQSRVTDAALKSRFAVTLAGMKAAADAEDAGLAAQFNRAELDQVDELETFFARHAG